MFKHAHEMAWPARALIREHSNSFELVHSVSQNPEPVARLLLLSWRWASALSRSEEALAIAPTPCTHTNEGNSFEHDKNINKLMTAVVSGPEPEQKELNLVVVIWRYIWFQCVGLTNKKIYIYMWSIRQEQIYHKYKNITALAQNTKHP